MLVKEVDCIHLQAFEGCFGYLFDVVRPAIQGGPFAAVIRIRFPPELGCDHHPPTEWSECLANKLLVRERSIDFRSIEERYSSFYRRSNESDHFVLVFRRSIGPAHSHAPKSDR